MPEAWKARGRFNEAKFIAWLADDEPSPKEIEEAIADPAHDDR